MRPARLVTGSIALALLAACGSAAAPADSGVDAAFADRAFDAAPQPDASDGGTALDVLGAMDTPLAADTVTPRDAVATADGDDAPSPVDAAGGTDLSVSGPFATSMLHAGTTMPTATGCAGTQCAVTIDVTSPIGAGAGPLPLVIITNGFLIDDSEYATYAARLASWGYVALRWNTTGETAFHALDHATLAAFLPHLIDWAATAPITGGVATAHVLLAGHSRGGKVSVLAAVADARVAGVFGLDPVDSPPPFTAVGPRYPSAVAALMSASRAIPLAVVGTGLGGMTSFGMACAPTTDNYAHFYDAAMSPAFEAVVLQAGHTQFVDNESTCGVACSACPTGSDADATVRAFTQTELVAWAERVLRGADTTRYTSGAWIAGEVAAGLVSTRNR